MVTVIAAIWAAYVLALPFQRMWVLPELGAKFQPPEVVFLGLAVVTGVQWARRQVRWRFTLTDLAPAAWVAANLLAFVWSSEPQQREGVIEVMTAVYVAGLYAVARLTATPQLLDRFGAWFAHSVAIAAALGIAGRLSADAGVPTPLATSAFTPIPYLGHAARAQAFTAGPQMLASILLVAVTLFVGSRMPRGWRWRDRAVLLLLVLGLAATVSKTALCLVAGLAVMWACTRWRVRPKVAIATWVIVAGLFALGSHVMVLRDVEAPVMREAQLIAGAPLASFQWRDQRWVAVPTTYSHNKQASLLAIWRDWPAGVGPAGQPAFTQVLQASSEAPRTMWIITPHSTYLGTVAELGAAGLGALLILFLTAGRTIRRLLASRRCLRWEAAAYAGVAAAFLIEAISTDLLNCRHYWLLLGVMAGRLNSLQNPVECAKRDSRIANPGHTGIQRLALTICRPPQ